MKDLKNCCEKPCCSDETSVDEARNKELRLEFMYIDLNVCERCLGTDSALNEAAAEIEDLLQSVGHKLEIRKILVETEEQAKLLKFISSPTIRINGRDIQMELQESLCESCAAICDTSVDCRVWNWQGKEYSSPPKAMIIDAILRAVYGGHFAPEHEFTDLPANLKRFFAAKNS